MNLAERLLRRASETPDAPAIFYRGDSLSYSELSGRIYRLAFSFTRMGVVKGEAVALIMRNCPEFVITYLALARIGAVAVPLNPLMTESEIASAIDSSGSVGMVVQEKFAEHARQSVQSCHSIRFTVVSDGSPEHCGQIAFDDLLNRTGGDLPETETADDDLAALLFTSGVTGRSKAVMLTHGNLIANTEDVCAVLRPVEADRFLVVIPMFHCFCWTASVLTPLMSGGSIVAIEAVQPFSDIVESFSRYGVTVFMGVPALLAALLKVPGFDPVAQGLPLKWCLSGASPLPAGLQDEFERHFRMPLIEGYGLTETSPVLTVNPPGGVCKHGSVGPALPGVELQIRAEDDTVLPTGAIGEVMARGKNVMKGYWNDAATTEAAFTGDGWLRTGDVGYLDEDGYLFLVDRKKDLVIVKGLNVYPREVEDILMEHPAVAEAAVIGVPDARGDEKLRAYVTLKKDAVATPKELSALFKGRLAPYKVPKVFTIIDEMPVNHLGKTLKRELREMARREAAARAEAAAARAKTPAGAGSAS